MSSLFLLIVMSFCFWLAYKIYGRFLAQKIFRLNPQTICPSHSQRDDLDYIPTNKQVLFGHHFTSIAGLGPIVGPAIAIIWGWVPAVLWILFGSIFIGAVHDFGALIISLRAQGRSVGDLAADIINKRVRTLFLLIIFFGLWIVISVFALIIAILFTMYPESVLPVWLQIPIAVILGIMIYQKNKNPNIMGIIAVILMYLTIIMGAFLPLNLPGFFGFEPIAVWIVILLIYVFFASTLPVQLLLQPRDFINSYQLLVAMVFLALGICLANPSIVAPAINLAPPGAPALFPAIFVVIACGAISGFHSLVSSGTSSKQCDKEQDTLFIGYGSMLIEAILAILVIIAVSAGLGMGLKTQTGEVLKGVAAFNYQYASWSQASGLSSKLSAFVTGSANLIRTIGIPAKITITIMGVFLVSFAATTLDTATRIQRYVVGELACAWRMPKLKNKYSATCIAVFSALVLAFFNGSGKGALVLWPLFGALNQLLAGLALLVITISLARKKINALATAIPMVFMILMTGWAMLINLNNFYKNSNWGLFVISICVLMLEIWMILESGLVIKEVYAKKSKK
ncbi:MAG: carbon starvation protein A [Candidatus Omnitrophota bacterium]